MDLTETVEKIVEIRKSERSGEDLDMLRANLTDKLTEVEDHRVLTEALELDERDVLPFREKQAIYDRLLQLRRSPEHLRRYAWWLQLNGGPDWDDEADRLLSEANELAS